MKFKILTFLLLSPLMAFAQLSDLPCKLYNSEKSAQMKRQSFNIDGIWKTYLIFDRPIAWYDDVLRFELIYASPQQRSSPQTFVAKAKSRSGPEQIVEIILNPPESGTNIRSGVVRAGDLIYSRNTTIGKHNTYGIQCFNSYRRDP